MGVKKTTFKATTSALQFEYILLNEMDIPRTAFHRKMIDYLIKNEIEIHPFLLIRRRSDPNYVKREATEQIYLDDVREVQIKEVAQKYNCHMGTVLFQALLSYSIAIAPDVLGKAEMEKLFPGMK